MLEISSAASVSSTISTDSDGIRIRSPQVTNGYRTSFIVEKGICALDIDKFTNGTSTTIGYLRHIPEASNFSGWDCSGNIRFVNDIYFTRGNGIRTSTVGQVLGESAQGNILLGWGIKDSGGSLNFYGHGGVYARSTFHAASGGDYTGSWTKTSDKRLKEKIKALNSNVDDIILDFKPVEYDLKEDESGTRYFGLIAQDVAETLEKYGYDSKKYSTVNELSNPEGYLGIDYNDFTPMLIHLCQSQQKKIDDLEERLSKLEGKLELI